MPLHTYSEVHIVEVKEVQMAYKILFNVFWKKPTQLLVDQPNNQMGLHDFQQILAWDPGFRFH